MAANSGGSSVSVLISSLDDGWLSVHFELQLMSPSHHWLTLPDGPYCSLGMDCIEDIISNRSSFVGSHVSWPLPSDGLLEYQATT
jgi:hypothetical protein